MALNYAVVVSLILALFMLQAQPMKAQPVGNLTVVVRVTVKGLRNTVTGLPIANLPSPIFSGALVQVRVGVARLAVGITDSSGSVAITLSPTLLRTTVTALVNTLLHNGTLTVLTPVLNIPTGFLNAPLVLIGNSTTGILRIIDFGPDRFTLIRV